MNCSDTNLKPKPVLSIGVCSTDVVEKNEQDASKSSSAEPVRWYVLRYKTFSNSLSQLFAAAPYPVFLPLRQSSKRGVAVRPFVSGYAFVQGTLAQAREVSKYAGLPLWRRLGEQGLYTYVTVHHAAMRTFISACEAKNQAPDGTELPLFDATYINLQKDDEVVIRTGPFQGIRGYLKTRSGAKGGLVVIPFSAEGEEKAPAGGEILFTYGIAARPEDLSVLRFAPGNRHAYAAVSDAAAELDTWVAAIGAGKTVSARLQGRLQTYRQRYADTAFDTPVQEALHVLNLYRIALLTPAPPAEQEALRTRLEHDILPAYEARVHRSEQRHRPHARAALQAYLARKQAVEALFSAASATP